MKLNKSVTLIPTPYRDEKDNVIVPAPLTLEYLDLSYIIRKNANMVYAQITGIPGVLVLTTTGNDISNLTIQDLENLLVSKLTDDPQTVLQNLFPKSIDSDPNGPGSVLSNMLSFIGIKSSPTCSCKQRAIEMNEKGNDWCEINTDLIVGWLKEESVKRNLPFIETIARALIKRAIKTSRKLKSKNV